MFKARLVLKKKNKQIDGIYSPLAVTLLFRVWSSVGKEGRQSKVTHCSPGQQGINTIH